MLLFYRLIVSLLFFGSLPILLPVVLLTSKHRRGLWQRLGKYRLPPSFCQKRGLTIWLHASSVGEVQAARPIIDEIQTKIPSATIILTTMTERGRKVAEAQLKSSIPCFLAPLDVPWIVERAIESFSPDIYLCMETELWPILIDSLSRREIRLCLVNGRLSDRSFGKYMKMRSFIQKTVQQFDRIAVISSADRDKYLALGARKDSLAVAGNVKYDLPLPADRNARLENYREVLGIGGEKVFIAGSTHEDEELQIAASMKQSQNWSDLVLVIAPRHLERMESIRRSLSEANIDFQLLTALKSSSEKRTSQLILVDTMGELALLYGIADYIFCGGSLVPKGGHNLMEAAVWDRAVFYGPHVEDFHDAALLLEQVEAGFKVSNIMELIEKITFFRDQSDAYRDACLRAGEVARQQRGSAERQVGFVLELNEFEDGNKNNPAISCSWHEG